MNVPVDPPAPRGEPVRFHSLDALRGIAALSVVFWHWQHFFTSTTQPRAWDVEAQPFWSALSFFYRHGGDAVSLFFCLSGFVFFWLYADAVRERRVGAREFAVLRFSRLYPLHLATLLLVLAVQLLYRDANGAWFVYPHNDARHFVLNLLFASSWGFEEGFSFNAPVWSVSVEVLLYALFFACALRLRPRAAWLVPAAAIGWYGVARLYEPLGQGLALFFIGGCALLAYRHLARASGPRAHVVLAALVAASWVATWLVDRHGQALAPLVPLDAFDTVAAYWPIAWLYPATIVALALFEHRRGTLGRRLAFLGDISYASYLLHFPLQLVAATVVTALGIGTAIYASPVFMLAFFATLIALSLAAHHGFERPMQRWLRARFGASARPGLRPESAASPVADRA